MARNQTAAPTVQNIFALNRFRKECYYEPIRVDFSPIQRPNNPSDIIVPFFNNDHNYFTPAFILKKQKALLVENLLAEKNKFEDRIAHSQKPSENKTPQYKPTDSRYCQLCSEYFADYWEHINDKYHKRMINSSKFNRDIMALCETFKVDREDQKPEKTKKIEKKKSTKIAQNFQRKAKDQIKTKLSEGKGSFEEIKFEEKEQKVQQRTKIESSKEKNTDQSLKIMLQLGNYSTNILNSHPFKQLFPEG